MGGSAMMAFVSLVSSLESSADARRGQRATEAFAAEERERFAALQAEPEPSFPDPEAIKRARRRSITNTMRRRGRARTILSDPTQGQPLGA